MVILDLFSGMGGFSKGIIDAGIPITKHYFSEINAEAIAVYQNNFPHAIFKGSVSNLSGRSLGRIDIITFGSPCQDFSLAGKRKGMDGQRSSLVEHAIRLVAECRPKFFIWENVKGTFSSNNSEDFWAIIQAFANIGAYATEWQLVNTSWLLPQNRERLYLIGLLAEFGGSFAPVFPITPKDCQPFQYRGSQPNNATTLGGGETLNTIRCGGMGSLTQKHNWDIIQLHNGTKTGYQNARVGDSVELGFSNNKERRSRVSEGIAQNLDTNGSKGVVVPIPSIHSKPHGFFKGRTSEETAPTIQATSVQTNVSVSQGLTLRRLTEIECERLQGFPDNWTAYGVYDLRLKEQYPEIFKISVAKIKKGLQLDEYRYKHPTSSTQRYKMCGNAVTAKMVEMIASKLKKNYNL